MRAAVGFGVALGLLLAGCSADSQEGTEPAGSAAEQSVSAPASATADASRGSTEPGAATQTAEPSPSTTTAGSAPASAAQSAPAAPQAPAAGSRYSNGRYGFSIVVPEGLQNLGEAPNGDGSIWQDGNATLRAYGSNNSAGRPTLESEQAAVRDSGGEVLEATGNADDFTIVARMGSDVQRTRFLTGSSSHVVAQWLYPQGEAGSMDAKADQSLGSLRAGDLSVAH